MRKFVRLVMASLVLTVSLAGTAASQNFDNGNPVPLSAGFPWNIGSDDVFPLHIADDFALPASAPTISRIMWFGSHGEAATDREFDIDIYGSGVIPWIMSPTPIWSVRGVAPTRSPVMSGGAPMMIGRSRVYRYDFRPSTTIVLNPNVTHWICIRAASSPGITLSESWHWSHSLAGTGNTQMEVPGFTSGFVPTLSILSAHNRDVAFKLFP